MAPMGHAGTIDPLAASGLRGLSRRTRLGILWIAGALVLVAVFAHRLRAPVYNVFADRVTCLGIPNFTNVASNLAFVLAGVVALAWFWRERSRLLGTRFRSRTELALYASFFAAAVLVGIGSGYYHWRPTNATLFWDRCPMTLAGAALAGAFLAERVDTRTGAIVALALALLLPATLVYWRMSEAAGAENLWPYLAGFYGSLGVATLVISVDAFHHALGLPLEPLPEPGPGAPRRRRPAGAAAEEAWVPMLRADRLDAPERDLYGGAPRTGNVIRALSLVPDEVRAMADLSAAQYLTMRQMMRLDSPRAIGRAQIELVAGRVSALRECFY